MLNKFQIMFNDDSNANAKETNFEEGDNFQQKSGQQKEISDQKNVAENELKVELIYFNIILCCSINALYSMYF